MHTPADEDTLNVALIRRHLRAQTVGQQLHLYPVVPSTNAVLRELAARNAPEGTVVLAEAQTEGRGRAGKPWFSPPDVNLYASVLFRPDIPVARAPVFSFMASLALTDAIRELGLAPAIKWPNDVLVRGGKVAGTLAEMSTVGEAVNWLVLGVGVNVNITREALVAALGPAGEAATSLLEERNYPVNRNAFAGSFLGYVDGWLTVHREQGPGPLLRAWRDLDVVAGRRVEIIRDDTEVLDGRARGVDGEGHLEVEDTQGRSHRIVSGQLRLLD